MAKQTTDDLILQWIADDPDSFTARVLDRIVPDGDHQLWSKATTAAGYGVVGIPWKYAKNKLAYIHRAVWLLHNGPVPDGMVVDHDRSGCGIRHCAAIEHLSLERDGITSDVYRTTCRTCGDELRHYGGRLCCRSCRLRVNREWKSRQPQ